MTVKSSSCASGCLVDDVGYVFVLGCKISHIDSEKTPRTAKFEHQ